MLLPMIQIYQFHIHPVYIPIVITYALQLSWHERVIEVKPFLQTVSAESIGPQARSRPNPVTVVKNFRYETGNVYVPMVPVTPCLVTDPDVIKSSPFATAPDRTIRNK